jgi:hypothetical protein
VLAFAWEVTELIRTVVVYTEEIDDAKVAIWEIMTQLIAKGNLLSNTVGLISCHYDFVHSGVVKKLCDALPFPVVGAISSAQAVKEKSGELLLTLMVLTSDDTTFGIGLTPSLKGSLKGISATYAETRSAREDKPSLVLAFAPFILGNTGDDYVRELTAASGGVPCFGTLAIDDTAEFESSFSIYNGESYRDRLIMVLIYGHVSPRFFVATMSPDKILDRTALVTKSRKNILMELNKRPVVEFFEDLGLTHASEELYAMVSLPFVVDYGDGTPPVSRVFIELSPEKHAVCAGDMPEGSRLNIGVFDNKDVLLTSEQALDQALDSLEEANGLLVYTCLARIMTLGAEHLAEFNLLRGKSRIPFMMASSGGELCPTRTADGAVINRFHNNVLIACVF